MRILIVDDHPDAANALAVLMTMEGFEVQVASSGEEALRMADLQSPDVSILDINMPGMDGHALATRLRETQGGARRLLVALTGRCSVADRLRTTRSGFDAHFSKPVELSQLLDRIEVWRSDRPAPT